MKTTRPEELLAEARARRPGLDPKRRERLKRAVVASVAASAGAAASASQAASLGGGWFTSVTAKVVLGVAAATLGSAATVGVMSATKRRAPVAPQAAPARAAAPLAAAVEGPAPEPGVDLSPPALEPAVAAPTPSAAVAPPVSSPSRVVVSSPTPTPSVAAAPSEPGNRPDVDAAPTPDLEPAPVARVAAGRSVAPPSAPALAAQLEQLQRAMRFSEAGDDAGALALLEQWERQFGSGPLHLEAKTLRLLVLCRLGRRDDAVGIWGELERLAPQTLKTPRLERSCAAPERAP